MCVCVLMALRMLITLNQAVQAGGRKEPYRFKRWPPQIQEVAPTTYVVWHFALCGTLLCVGNGF